MICITRGAQELLSILPLLLIYFSYLVVICLKNVILIYLEAQCVHGLTEVILRFRGTLG